MLKLKKIEDTKDTQLRFMASFIMDIIAPLDEEEIDFAIENNISLVSIAEEMVPDIYRAVQSMAYQYNDKLKDITIDAVVDWLENENTKLGKIFHEDKRKEWLKYNIEEFLGVIDNR